jgi:hypothetical protein
MTIPDSFSVGATDTGGGVPGKRKGHEEGRPLPSYS